MRIHSNSPNATFLMPLMAPLLVALGTPGCGSDAEGAETAAGPPASSAVPAQSSDVVAEIEGTLDETTLSIRALAPGAPDAAAPEVDGPTVAESLDQLPSTGSGPGATSTASSVVALEQPSPVMTEAAWDTAHCGPVPLRGRCALVKMRDLFPDRRVMNAYFYLQSITPRSGVTVRVAPVNTAPASPGLTGPGIPPVPNALWRFGNLVPMTPESRAPSRYLVFTGTATGAFAFSFRGQVIGTLR